MHERPTLERTVIAYLVAGEKQREAALAVLNGTMALNGSSEPELTLNELSARIGLHRRTIEKYNPPRHLKPSGWRYYESEVAAHIVDLKRKRKSSLQIQGG